ncbi:MAG: LysM peptidoglycan-binding domain-containing protein [Clostridiales bacterium]|nr:LysM peptidoglycan-binding domain-containing protein [Clostridiales bacterium]
MGNDILLPKNIRQIGEIQGRRKIYLEDYVMTYIRKMENRGSEDFLGVLLGERKYMDDAEYVFVRGIMEVPGELGGGRPKQEIRGTSEAEQTLRESGWAAAAEQSEANASRIVETNKTKITQLRESNSGKKPAEEKESVGENVQEKEKTGLWQAFQKRYGTQEEWTSEEGQGIAGKQEKQRGVADTEKTGERASVKSGQKENGKDDSVIPKDQWESCREEWETHFPGSQVVGCCVIGTWETRQMEELTQRIPEAKQLLYHLQDQEERLYWLEGEQYEGVTGYFVFYEQNRQMQEYLSELFGESSVEKESAPDKAIISFREKVKNKADEKSRSFLKLASSFFVVGALIVGVIAVNRVSDLRQAASVAGTSTVFLEDGQETSSGSGDASSNTSDSKAEDALAEASAAAESADNTDDEEKTGNVGITENGTAEDSISVSSDGGSDAADLSGIEDSTTDTTNISEILTGSDAFWTDDETAVNAAASESAVTSGISTDTDTVSEADAASDMAAVSEAGEISETEAAVTATSRQVQASYTIRTGDTLAEICAKYYGSLERLEELCEVNGIEDADHIIPGQKIVLP